MSRLMYQDFRPAVDLPSSPPALSWYEPRMAAGLRIIQPHAHCFSAIRKVGDPYDPWNFRDEDGTGELFDEPSYPDALFESPYGEQGKLAWVISRNADLPLSKAVESGDLEGVRALLSGDDITAAGQKLIQASHPETGEAAIHIAAATSKTDILELLLSSGAQVDTRDRNGWTPLMYLACTYGKQELYPDRVSA
ncbi:hypothetical protein V8E36_005156 [Tilletia maclaganii]